MFPNNIEQLVYVACVHVVYGYTLHSTHRCANACTIATRLYYTFLIVHVHCHTGIVIHNIILNSSFHLGLHFVGECKNVEIWYWGSPPPPLRNKS